MVRCHSYNKYNVVKSEENPSTPYSSAETTRFNTSPESDAAIFFTTWTSVTAPSFDITTYCLERQREREREREERERERERERETWTIISSVDSSAPLTSAETTRFFSSFQFFSFTSCCFSSLHVKKYVLGETPEKKQIRNPDVSMDTSTRCSSSHLFFQHLQLELSSCLHQLPSMFSHKHL